MKRVKFIFSNFWKARQNDRTAKKSEKRKRKEEEKWRKEDGRVGKMTKGI